MPVYANGQRRHGRQGDPADREALVTFDAARAAAARKGMDGVGLALLPEWGLVALDFDKCITNGELHPEVAEIAFEPFTVGASERDRLRSSGLGLAVVAAVATAHGGTAALQPADRGTIIELRLPAHPPTTTHA